MELLVGFAGCLVTAICFSSMYVPIRNYNTGDGVFAHWMLCLGIFLSGFVINWINGLPQLQPLAMLGGTFFAICNVVALPIYDVLGLGVANLILGIVGCVAGWSAGNFGLFGLKRNENNHPFLNYFGVILVCIGGVIFSFVKPTKPDTKDGYEKKPIPLQKRIIAIVVCLITGLANGFQFVPVIYIQDHKDRFKNAEDDGISYVFSQYCGAFLTSCVFFIAYTIYKKNEPYVNPKLIVPSLLGGVIWSIGQLAWFIANDKLSQSISFPINAMMPGVFAALWSIFYYREIKGRRNMIILTVAILITSTGACLVGLSKSL
ncbi:transmembrane family of transporters domain-containing protein [Ditylenchus destructor]|nr:transmembrane family of transporters domain-containing protein [Ditylenchus destructor]